MNQPQGELFVLNVHIIQVFIECKEPVINFRSNNFRSRNVYNKAEADRQITALFLKRERQHTELMHPSKKQMNHMYRERSIDDGSHFDPRLDKYQAEPGGTLKRSPKKQGSEEKEKKFGTLKRVFTCEILSLTL